MKDELTTLLNHWGVEHRIEHDEFVLKGSKLRIRFPSVNEDIAYLLGFLCGDGCLGKPQPRKVGGARYKTSICFSGSERGKSQAQYICDIFRRHFNYVPRAFNRKRKGGKGWLSMEINSAVIYAYFCRLGLPTGEKYGKLKVPPVVCKKALFKKFLRGLIDSDGHIEKNGRIVIVQKDVNFLTQVRESCLKFLNFKFSIPQPNSKKVGDRTYTWYYILTFKAERLATRNFLAETSPIEMERF